MDAADEREQSNRRCRSCRMGTARGKSESPKI